jgi:hypothetical protein
MTAGFGDRVGAPKLGGGSGEVFNAVGGGAGIIGTSPGGDPGVGSGGTLVSVPLAATPVAPPGAYTGVVRTPFGGISSVRGCAMLLPSGGNPGGEPAVAGGEPTNTGTPFEGSLLLVDEAIGVGVRLVVVTFPD